MVVAKKSRIWNKLRERASITIGWDDARVADHLSLRKLHDPCLALTYGLHLKIGRKRVDGFSTHAVQTDRLLEYLAVVFGACVELRYGFGQLAQRNAASIVADAYFFCGFVDRHLNLLAETRGELVDGVVDHLFDEYIDAVVL